MLTGCNAESSVARDTPVPLGATPAVTAGADTTRPQFDPTVVAVLQSADDGIPRRCVANADNVGTVRTSQLVQRIAVLSDEKMDAIGRAIKFALALP